VNDSDRLRYLRIALVVFGVFAVVGIYPLTRLWPSSCAWHTGAYNDYALMVVAIYATLGVFLIRAARDPLANLSLIWFTVWSSVVHALVIAVQAVVNTEHLGHLVGDVPFLLVAAAVLALLTPRGTKRAALEQGAV
jgi:hypothetical protein